MADLPFASPILDRRALLSGAMVAALPLPRLQAAAPTFMPGVQLWTLNAELPSDLDGGLAALAELGFREVETAGLYGRSPADFRAALDRAGLVCTACHDAMSTLRDDANRAFDWAQALGALYVVCSSPQPSRTPDPALSWAQGLAAAMTADDWNAHADDLNRLGRTARESGLGVGYHNHDFELVARDGATPLETLMRLTDPELVKFEIDVGWVWAGGGDPAAFINAHAPRIGLAHLKDMRRDDGGAVRSTPLGQGSVDWPAVLAALSRVGVRHAYIEQEAPFERPPLDSLRTSLDYLHAL